MQKSLKASQLLTGASKDHSFPSQRVLILYFIIFSWITKASHSQNEIKQQVNPIKKRKPNPIDLLFQTCLHHTYL
ncbi:hypothetical protein C4K46_02600 [Streptococcus oricebi]|uniref:Uncharacterized protein n=1 Tax=Streptococcus oricebi TaxID=1547447 RepID=A0ABS5B1W9_9STRE|nr:hypothetical protein [Streptococcus oricebi]